ncbi:MAG: TonB family protein [Beijerinckiaceae bacterium]|nr:TonB family protein [Beijerinckiaceae bacterium]MCI0735491.1 TonB family protein [Beijerinckiaceae bacterium]
MSAAAFRQYSFDGKLWSLAAGIAASLHLGAAAALLTMSPELESEETGAPAIEISLAPAAPHVIDTPDVPPGPLADEAAAASPSVASPEDKEIDQPKVARAEAEEADVTRGEKSEKPIEDPSPAPRANAVLSSESSASEATAPPKSEAALPAPKPAAPAHGLDRAAQAAKLSWERALLAHFNRHKRYPGGAQRRTAEVSVAFTLDRRGHVTGYRVKRTSGVPAFDEAALAMIRRAHPVPAPPPAIADEELTFEVPVLFRAGQH